MSRITPTAEFYNQILQKHIASNVEMLETKPIEGGCINNAQRISTIKGDFFIKWNADVSPDVFEKESLGLELLRKQNIISIPQVLGVGTSDNIPYLLLEFIQPSKRKPDYWKDFGKKLARLHQVNTENYGLNYNNFIGSLTQNNTEKPKWIDFYIENRLKHQLKIGKSKKLISAAIEEKFERLFEKLPDLLIEEKPSLLHGDLWTGNVMTDTQGYVCLLDPAIYYGNREIELASTQLFGGFEPDFFSAYFQDYPMKKGFEKRFEIYQLYPLLVHVNLFGEKYLPALNSILKKHI